MRDVRRTYHQASVVPAQGGARRGAQGRSWSSMQEVRTDTPFAEAARAVAEGAEPLAESRKLVASMTVEERLGCLDGDVEIWPGIAEMTIGYHEHPWPAAAVPRLGVPGIAFS